jgi:hypothetical protein
MKMESNINMAAPVLLKLFSAQTRKSSLPGEPTTWPTAEPFKILPPLACAKHFSGLFPAFLK